MPTPTSLPKFTLSGVIFFDYNGNGVHDAYELPIPGATVQVDGLVAASGDDGSYALQGVLQGQRQVKLAAESFRYISLSLEAFQATEEPVVLTVDADVQRDFGLLEGFLTLPMPCGAEYQIGNFFDHDSSRCPEGADPHDANRCPDFRDWKGERQTYDGEGGTDFRISLNTPVLAAAPGIVIKIDYDDAAVSFVILEHSYDVISRYHHLDTTNVSLSQRVKRGDVIAFSGQIGDASHPHVHFEIRVNDIHRDPYRDLLDANSKGYWTKDNDPQCVE
jgi:murein DD-endopeptidase MepM/ murein hydrolase activator NlpD